MDLTKVLSGSGGGRDDVGGNGEVAADGSNTADSHQHEYRDLFASDNEGYSKTLAKSSHPIPAVGGVYVIKKDLEDTFKTDEEIEGEIMAMVIDEVRKEILEQQRESTDFFTREEERLASKLSENNKQIKLLKAEIASKKAEIELISKNLELSKANIVYRALRLHSCKIKMYAGMAELKSAMESLSYDWNFEGQL